LRRDNPTLVYGAYELLQKDHPEIYAYTRGSGEDRMLVLLNFSKDASTIELPEIDQIRETLINNYSSLDKQGSRCTLLPYQAVICKLK
jgi:oligo-1,6-glucosidase